MKLYLAHPIGTRHDVRKWELEFEKRTGIELDNPFYDTERQDIVAIDQGKQTPFNITLDFHGIVRDDLAKIDSCDGLVASVDKSVPSIGTFMEMWYCGIQSDKPVFVVSPNWDTHPWLRYVTDESDGFIVKDWAEFEKRIVKRVKKRRLNNGAK